MELKEYFEEKRGTGILATADGEGRVNAALYARPHVMEDGSAAFIMADRLSHTNLESNPSAVYLFIEQGGKSVGKRLYLKKKGEEKNSPLIEELRRKPRYPDDEGKDRFLVFFTVEKILPLIGDGSEE